MSLPARHGCFGDQLRGKKLLTKVFWRGCALQTSPICGSKIIFDSYTCWCRSIGIGGNLRSVPLSFSFCTMNASVHCMLGNVYTLLALIVTSDAQIVAGRAAKQKQVKRTAKANENGSTDTASSVGTVSRYCIFRPNLLFMKGKSWSHHAEHYLWGNPSKPFPSSNCAQEII